MEKQIRLALIDDDEGVLCALGMLLQALSFHVDSFSSAKAGIEFVLGADAVDVVVTDLRMPVLTGEDVVRQLRAAGMDLPIIIMSGHATSSDTEALKRLGMSAFLAKPFPPDAFLRTVKELLDKAPKRNAA